MVYYITVTEDGVEEELELRRGSIYLKCAVCGEKYAPVEFSFIKPKTEDECMWRSCCPRCYAEYDERKRKSNSNRTMAEMLSAQLEMQISADDIQRLFKYFEGKDASYAEICDYFKTGCHLTERQ